MTHSKFMSLADGTRLVFTDSPLAYKDRGTLRCLGGCWVILWDDETSILIRSVAGHLVDCGNAIVPQAAAVFLRVWMDVLGIEPTTRNEEP